MRIYIELNQVTVYLPGQSGPVLHKLDLAVRQGEWLAVVGRNGCGKSVLARLLAGLDGRYDGEIRRSAEGTAVGLVMQNPEAQLVGETVWEDMIFGLECRGVDAGEIPRQAKTALEEAGLAGLEERPVRSLSGGQKQLLALAGALAAGPLVLVADEATSMLDPGARERFLHILRQLHRQGTAIVMITQLLEETAYADRLVALAAGRMVYDGDVRPFFYGEALGEPHTPCQGTGLLPPYTVEVVRELQTRGLLLAERPLTPQELEKAVAQL